MAEFLFFRVFKFIFLEWQTMEFMLLQAFVPPIAGQLMVSNLAITLTVFHSLVQAAAEKSPLLINALGTPNLSQFSTFAYGAGPHIDRDESPTIGRVFRRSSKVGLKFSNRKHKRLII